MVVTTLVTDEDEVEDENLEGSILITFLHDHNNNQSQSRPEGWC